MENETSYWEAKNTLAVYFDVIFDWDKIEIDDSFMTLPL